MRAPKIMFVDHSSKIAGAELILLDVVRSWRGATAFLFEEGPLNEAIGACGLNVITSKWAGGLNRVRRDKSLLRTVPLAGRLCALVVEISRAARRHDVIYANSQKAFVFGALAAALARHLG